MATLLEALREWVRAEIYYALAENEEDSEGYKITSHGDRDVANQKLENLKDALETFLEYKLHKSRR